MPEPSTVAGHNTEQNQPAPLVTGRHSLHVAALAAFVAHRRGYDDGLKRHLVIAGQADASEGGDLFSSPINIDTIEGIIRSYRYLRDTPAALDPLQVAEASFISRESSRPN